MADKEKADEAKQKLANNADALYVSVAEESAGFIGERGGRSKVFYQEDLLAHSDGLPDFRSVMPLVQYLTNHGLFRTLKYQGRLGWSVRPRGAAKSILSLERDDRMCYEVIEEAHEEGIWVRDVKKKTNLAQQTVSKCLARLEKANLVKGIKSIKAPAQRIYMLSHLTPSENVTGNSFFDAGELDESFRDELLNLIIFWVRQQSWAESKKKHKREPTSPILVADDHESAGKKRKRTNDIEDAGQRPKYRSAKFDPETDFTQLVYRAGTHNYPTAEQVHEYLANCSAIKPGKAASLTVSEIQGCLDVLCWDEKLEKVPNKEGIAWGYRTVRGVVFKPTGMYEEFEEHPGTGFTQAPCGRCPVFDLCHESGPVNPQECVYFEQWLRG